MIAEIPKPTGVQVHLDADKIDQFKRTGHPRTVAILLGGPNPNRLFTGVEVEMLVVETRVLFVKFPIGGSRESGSR